VPEPTEGEPHPFADIIDLFRELDAAQETTATPLPPRAGEPRGGVPVGTPKAPTPPPSRRRRAVLLLPVALLALTSGATAAVLQHRHDAGSVAAPTATAPSERAALADPAAGATPSAAPTSSSSTRLTTAYGEALDALASARGTADLTRVTHRASVIARHLRTAGRATGRATGDSADRSLARAEAAHLDSLVALGLTAQPDADDSASGSTPSDPDFPALVAAATKTAARVERAATGRSDVPDPSPATTHVVALVGATVVGRLDAQVAELAGSAAGAGLTAQLRAVAARATALAPTAADIVAALPADASPSGNATAPGDAASPGHATAKTDATAAVTALQALGSLSVLDGDHLDAWTTLSGRLRQALTAAGVSDAAQDVTAIDTMIAAARQKLLAWAAGNASATSTPTMDGTTRAAIDAYQADATALIDRSARTLAALPVLTAGQESSFDLATRFHTSVRAFASLGSAVAALHPPAGMSPAQRALAVLVTKARAAAATGQAVAISAAECDPGKHACALGSMTEWPSYQRSIHDLGNSASVRAILASTARTAKKPPGSATTTTPPKPVV
jgi:hypothetical protein